MIRIFNSINLKTNKLAKTCTHTTNKSFISSFFLCFREKQKKNKREIFILIEQNKKIFNLEVKILMS